MNLLLLFPADFIDHDKVCLTDHRLQHLLAVKKVQVNDTLEVGLLNDKLGLARVLFINKYRVDLHIQLLCAPPAPLPVQVILALPRPKMLKRILQTISAMGVKQLTLIHSAKVEKSYWQTPWLEPQKLQQNLILGLEQGKDTRLPEVTCFQRFKPFVEDRLPELIAGTTGLVAHPGQGQPCRALGSRPVTLVIGPEGGFIDYEIDKLVQAGLSVCHLGGRILRVETAIAVLLGRFLY